MHPEATAGATRAAAANRAMGHDVDDNLSPTFTKDTAEKTGIDIRRIQRDAERGEKVTEETMNLIRGTDLDTGAIPHHLK
jgi:hypothetical protein